MDISPIIAILLNCGIDPTRMDSFINLELASYELAPKLSISSISRDDSTTEVNIAFNDKETPFIQFPSNI